MDIRESIIINNRLLYWCISTKADYNFLSEVPFREWIMVRRHRFAFFRRRNGQGYLVWVNKKKGIW